MRGSPTWEKEFERIFAEVDRVLDRTAERLRRSVAKAAAPERHSGRRRDMPQLLAALDATVGVEALDKKVSVA